MLERILGALFRPSVKHETQYGDYSMVDYSSDFEPEAAKPLVQEEIPLSTRARLAVEKAEGDGISGAVVVIPGPQTIRPLGHGDVLIEDRSVVAERNPATGVILVYTPRPMIGGRR